MKPLVVAAWMLFICVGLAYLWKYQARPCDKGRAPVAWPADATVLPVPEKFNLVLSLHPHCPCSNATAEELDKLLAHTGSSMHVQVLLYAPTGTQNEQSIEQWTQSSLTAAVRNFPHTTITVDPDGKLAEKFGALTSGDAQLFSPDGRLLFHGGVTESRGHSGDSAGSNAILQYVNGGGSSISETPVFGCAIQPRESGIPDGKAGEK